MRLVRGGRGGRSRSARGVAARVRMGLACLLVLGACATRQPAPGPASGKVVDLNGEAPTDGPTKVRVDNQNLTDMTIYAYNGSHRIRLGRAAGNTTTDLIIPTSIVSGTTQLRFLAEPLGNQRGYMSEAIPVQPGDLVEFYVPVR